MNILVVGKKYTESFALHIYETLVEMDHKVVLYDPGIKIQQSNSKFQFRINQIKSQFYTLFEQTKFGIKYKNRKLEKIIHNTKFELVLCCHDFLSPSQIKMLKERFEAQIVLWFPDSFNAFRKAMFLNAKYDILFFKDLQIVKTLRNEYNLNAYYLPECCNPKYHKKVSLSKEDVAKYECDITTAGNMHTARAALFKNFGNYKVKIWGNPAPLWMDTEGLESMIQNQFVSNEVKSKAFLASKIVLNNFYPSEIQSANARLFEVAATGSFQICSHRDALSELYEIDKEIITYKTLDELFFKIDFYLKQNQLRDEIAERAYNRTIIEHTYQNRLTKLLAIVFDKNITD